MKSYHLMFTFILILLNMIGNIAYASHSIGSGILFAVIVIDSLIVIAFCLVVAIFKRKLSIYLQGASGKYLYWYLWIPVVYYFATPYLYLVGVYFPFRAVITFSRFFGFHIIVLLYYLYLLFCALKVYRVHHKIGPLISWIITAGLASIFVFLSIKHYH